ncbi:hypothetical protein [Antribacter gilvus]|uniref:hypothetical protein n=1 Tax=Antribacter gilvus TaxID=2304675 RepID=UPI00197F8170|nr:hypothetical protein [Antribacter gilvus]
MYLKHVRHAIGVVAAAALVAVGGLVSVAAPAAAADCSTGNAMVTGAPGGYTTRNGTRTVYTGSDYRAAIQAGVNSLTAGRTSQQHVAVPASGSIGASTISLPSHTSISICGTMNVAYRSGRGAIEALNASNVTIWDLNMTGNPYFGLRFYGMNGLHLGRINLNLSSGMGIRFERDFPGSRNVVMDSIYVSGASSHAVETWHINGLTVGTVTARNVGESGLLLQGTTNARIGTVDGNNVGGGTGYATLRMANRNGRLADGSYPTNVIVDRVVSRGGGRGIFCVSESGGVQIKNIDLASNGSNAILIENCYGVRIDSGTVNGGGEVRISARTEFANTRDTNITLRVDNTTVRESPCGVNTTWNITGNARVTVC